MEPPGYEARGLQLQREDLRFVGSPQRDSEERRMPRRTGDNPDPITAKVEEMLLETLLPQRLTVVVSAPGAVVGVGDWRCGVGESESQLLRPCLASHGDLDRVSGAPGHPRKVSGCV